MSEFLHQFASIAVIKVSEVCLMMYYWATKDICVCR